MKKTALIVTAVGGYLLYKFLKPKYQVIKNLDYNLADVKISMKGLQPIINVSVDLHNLTDGKLNVNSVNVKFFINNIEVGSSFKGNITIYPKQTTRVSFTINTIPVFILDTIIDIIKNKKIEFTAVGTIELLNLSIPFEFNRNIL